jgi:predicted pyridoxine 5'-phosphate oxidase superfamily flavin-nucleotide-binding protein
MEKITDDMIRLLDYVKLGYVATISSDNTPNLSPKGTIFALDDHHLVFADIRSPQTIKNLKTNPSVEINVVDPFSRKGYRFKGIASILTQGSEFSHILHMYKQRKIQSVINNIVKIRITKINTITSPLYDLGMTEEQLVKKWREYFLNNNYYNNYN